MTWVGRGSSRVRAEAYGVLGVAAALLFSLYLVGRLIVGSAVLNATPDSRRRRSNTEQAPLVS